MRENVFGFFVGIAEGISKKLEEERLPEEHTEGDGLQLQRHQR